MRSSSASVQREPAHLTCLVTQVRTRSLQNPHADALIQGNRRLDYATFWRHVEGFACALQDAGLKPGDRVAIILPNRPEAAVAMYGTWLAGGVAVPLNVQAREREFGAWLKHCGARHVVHEAANQDVVCALSGIQPQPVAWPLEPGEPLATAAGRFHGEDPSLGSIASILYTSGTTGAPKGVTLSHGNLASNTAAIISYLGLSSQDRVFSVLPCYYTYGASLLHTHLAVGASIVFADAMYFPQQTLTALANSQATGFSGVPSTFALLCERTETDGLDFSNLRYLTQAGGAMPVALTRRVQVLFPDVPLFVMYGQTEATSRLTWLPPERLDDKAGSVGIPVSGVQLCIADEHGTPLPVGSEGEVLARGPNVMQGYWAAPEATARALRNGWLHTGDLGRLDEDGFLWLAGRRDDVIKTGAHRVHPQDIEDVLTEVPGVVEAAVSGMQDDLLGQYIAAFVVAEGATELDIRRHCRTRMAAYKMPRTIHFVTTLPRTASGKVRRAALAQELATT